MYLFEICTTRDGCPTTIGSRLFWTSQMKIGKVKPRINNEYGAKENM